jgi:hypothetical protein
VSQDTVGAILFGLAYFGGGGLMLLSIVWGMYNDEKEHRRRMNKYKKYKE